MTISTWSPETRSRAAAAVAAVVLQALLAWALITGLSVHFVPRVEAALKVFNLDPIVPPPAPKPVPVRQAKRKPTGAAAPPHKRADPTPVVAPEPIVVQPPLPPPINAAPAAAHGADNAAGAAETGRGTGAGGAGDGRGSGAAGDGTGSGGTPAEWVSGNIDGYRDYPRAAREAGIGGALITRYVIDSRGRVIQCAIVESSGSELLDATTCRLVIARFRFAPARDASGQPVEDVQLDHHRWGVRQTPGRFDNPG